MSLTVQLLCAGTGGATYYTLRRIWPYRKVRKPEKLDIALAHPICPACSGEWLPWGEAKYVDRANRYEQKRTCKECGFTQRRQVPR